jgi:nitrate reductase gamma subunit
MQLDVWSPGCTRSEGSAVNDIISPDVLLYAVLPYVAFALFLVGSAERMLNHPETLTSRSSQFLENRQHFWAMVPFHYGILVVLAGHLVALAIPRAILGWNASALRLYILEASGLAFGLLAAGGLALAIVRRASVPFVRATTARFDWIVLAALLAQLVTGVAVAISYSWGSSWFAAVATPYLLSLARLRPDVGAIAALPLLVKAHVLGAFLLVGVFPFSRLVHVLQVPTPYLWRRPQIVRWYRPRPSL